MVQVAEDEDVGAIANVLPPEGFLVSSIAGDVRPLNAERSGIERLRRGQGHNPYLADWLFDIGNAAVPTTIPDLAGSFKSPFALDADQAMAVNKSLASPDLCVIQGPPGTGKTAAISVLIERVIAAGGRVLLASQTNLAIDNVLSRLPNSRVVRPLRVARSERVNGEAQEFLEDRVSGTWLAAVQSECRDTMRLHQDREERIAAATTAFEQLGQIAAEHAKSVAATDATSRSISEADARWHSLHAQRLDLAGGIERLRRQEAALRDFQTWRKELQTAPPQMDVLVDTPVSAGLVEMVGALYRGLSSLLWPVGWLKADSATAAMTAVQIIHQAALAFGKAGQLGALIAETISLCNGTTSCSSDPRLASLLAEKHRLLDSESEQDLGRLAGINRQIKGLIGDRWSQLCSHIGEQLEVVVGTDVPPDLDVLLSSLNPDPRWVNTFGRLSTFLGHLSDRIHAVFEAGCAGLGSTAAEFSEVVSGQIEQGKAQLAGLDEELQAIERQLDSLRTRAKEIAQQIEHLREQWDSCWPKACPDVTGSLPQSPAVSADVLQDRRAEVDRWLASIALEREQGRRWLPIQEDWAEQLAMPQAGESSDLRALYLENVNLVGATCYETGRREFWTDPVFQSFDVAIIDEVSKATPTELLMPMLLARKVILVGDHRQLQPMFPEHEETYAEAAEDGLIDRKDFRRFRNLVTAGFFGQLFQACPETIRQALLQEYRSHPQITAVKNLFYNGQLKPAKADPAMLARVDHGLAIPDRQGGMLLEEHQHVLWVDSSRDAKGRPFFETQRGSSKINPLEVDLTIAALQKLNEALTQKGSGPGNANSGPQPKRMPVGVITFYGAQLHLIRQKISAIQDRNPQAWSAIDPHTNTVDRFQGMERPIIIVSLVRSQPRAHLGEFVRQYQRINVAFSRAQSLLIIIGALETFMPTVIDLPSMNYQNTQRVRLYRSIYERVTEIGGRRYARQLLG